MSATRVIRDPIHGYIAVPDALAPAVDHPFVQRLRRVGQTSMTSTVYPGSNGSRFEHSLGAMQLARQAWRSAWGNAAQANRSHLVELVNSEMKAEAPTLEPIAEGDFGDVAEDAVAGVALLHDLGHPPFSHILEPFYKKLATSMLTGDIRRLYESLWTDEFHEAAGAILARAVWGTFDDERRSVLARLIYESDPDHDSRGVSVLHSIVAGELDVDRLDYLMRDAQKAGTEFGYLDSERLIASMTIWSPSDGKLRVAPSTAARSAAETVLLQRTQSYKWITFHHRVVAGNLALQRAVNIAMELADLTESPVTICGTILDLGKLIGRRRPNLDYFTPDESTFARIADIDLKALGDDQRAELAKATRRTMQSGVDDVAVLEWLKDVMLVTDALLVDDEFRGALRRDVKRLNTYLRVVLLRAKLVVPVWKTVEDFADSVAKLFEAEHIDNMIGRAIASAKARYPAESSQVALAALEAATSTAGDAQRRLEVANHLFQTLLSVESGRRRFLDDLKEPELKGALRKGFWDLTLTSFSPVRVEGQMAALHKPGSRAPVVLRDTSPMVRALEVAERARPQIHAYFFLDEEIGVKPYMLQTEFVAAFPRFLERELPAYVDGLATRVASATSKPD